MNHQSNAIDTFGLLEDAGTGNSCFVVHDVSFLEDTFVMKMTPGETLKEACKNLVHDGNIATLACQGRLRVSSF